MADLAAREFQEVGYLFVIEGVPVGWTNRVELAGTGGGSWIGTSSRTIALGLELPDTVKLAVGIVESGMPIDDGLSLTIVDRDGHLIAFNADEAGTAVYGRLAPTDDPAPPDLIDGGGLNVALHGKWINGEAIGADGERRLYQILPSGDLPGYDHAAIDSAVQDLRASTVQSAARWMEGRPCALYVIRRDPATGTWASWSSQHASGYSLIWWGTCRELSAESHVWKIECDGPSSWLRRVLNANRPADWRDLVTVLELGPGENFMASAFRYTTHNTGLQSVCGSSVYDPVDDALTPGTPEAMAAQIHNRLQAVASSAGPDDEFTAFKNGSVAFDGEKLAIRVDDNGGGTAYGGALYLRMHRKVWLHLGWDLYVQNRGPAELSTEQELVADLGPVFKPGWLTEESDPWSGYVAARFNTCPVGLYWNDSPAQVDGDGVPRIWRRYLEEAGPAVLYEGLGQSLDFGFEGQVPYLEGQLARPPADKTIDAGACDTTGFWALRGRFRDSAEKDPVMAYQMAKVSWVQHATQTTVEADADSRCLVWGERYLDPRAFGAPDGDHIGKTWVASDMQFVPVAVLGYNLDKPDAAHVVLQRLLLSTGTASWSGTEGDPNALLTIGENGHPDALLASGEDLRGNDLEIADLGLGIPHEMIDWSSFVEAAEALPGGKAGPLSRTRLAFVGPFDSQELIEKLLAPRAWCFSLRGGKYGLFARGAPLVLDDVEVAITPADIAGEPTELPPSETVDFRSLVPVDLIDVTFGGNQLDGGSGEKTVSIKARDPRAAQRRGNARIEIDGRTLLPDSSAWLGDFRLLWGEQMARWFAEPHALVTVRVKGHKARDLWPGVVVRYTSPWAATREGAYGMTGRIGRVVSVERNLGTLAATVTILVQAGDPSAMRRFGPLARLLDDVATVEARHDAAARTIYCYKDAWGHGEAAYHDVAGFAEPAWLGVGGDALAYVWSSWDGVTWEKTAEFEVESVSTANDSITYKTGTLDGTIWERRFTAITLAPWEDQDVSSWPRALFGVYCGSDGKFGAGDLAGYPWVE